MTAGTIVRLVRSYGSQWGLVSPRGDTRGIFFNASSLPPDAEFHSLTEGQAVDFEEERDRANGTHAVRVVLRPPGAVDPRGADPAPVAHAPVPEKE